MEILLNKMASELAFFQGTVLFIRTENVGELHLCLWILNRNADVCICFSKRGTMGVIFFLNLEGDIGSGRYVRGVYHCLLVT